MPSLGLLYCLAGAHEVSTVGPQSDGAWKGAPRHRTARTARVPQGRISALRDGEARPSASAGGHRAWRLTARRFPQQPRGAKMAAGREVRVWGVGVGERARWRRGAGRGAGRAAAGGRARWRRRLRTRGPSSLPPSGCGRCGRARTGTGGGTGDMGVHVETIAPGDGEPRPALPLSLSPHPPLLSVRCRSRCRSADGPCLPAGRTFPKRGQTCVVHYTGECGAVRGGAGPGRYREAGRDLPQRRCAACGTAGRGEEGRALAAPEAQPGVGVGPAPARVGVGVPRVGPWAQPPLPPCPTLRARQRGEPG